MLVDANILPFAVDALSPCHERAGAWLAAQLEGDHRVALPWVASSDILGVAGYRVYRNGAVVATTSVTSFTDSFSGKTSTYTYYVVAFDAAGNVSSPSNSVSIAG